jgi:predicted Na+-dependent transporter
MASGVSIYASGVLRARILSCYLLHSTLPLHTSMLVILAATSALIAPLLLPFFLPWFVGSEPLKVSAAKTVTTLLFTQFVPLCVGLAVREKRPAVANKLLGPAKKLSTILNLVAFAFILYVHWDTVTAISGKGFLGMFLLVLGTVVISWALGGANISTLRTMTTTTAVRADLFAISSLNPRMSM